VTCAVYSPRTIPLRRLVAVNPSICAPPATGFVTVQIRLGIFRNVHRHYIGYPFNVGVGQTSQTT
jgi:hypothetical protein